MPLGMIRLVSDGELDAIRLHNGEVAVYEILMNKIQGCPLERATYSAANQWGEPDRFTVIRCSDGAYSMALCGDVYNCFKRTDDETTTNLFRFAEGRVYQRPGTYPSEGVGVIRDIQA